MRFGRLFLLFKRFYFREETTFFFPVFPPSSRYAHRIDGQVLTCSANFRYSRKVKPPAQA